MLENVRYVLRGERRQSVLLCSRVSYRVQLLHLLLQHAGDHPDEAPVFELTCLLVKVCQQSPDRRAFTVQIRVPLHPPEREQVKA